MKAPKTAALGAGLFVAIPLGILAATVFPALVALAILLGVGSLVFVFVGGASNSSPPLVSRNLQILLDGGTIRKEETPAPPEGAPEDGDPNWGPPAHRTDPFPETTPFR